ncbi:MAG: hypothetical protein JNM64_20375 [Chloroflexia bacterium]|nr:hypothetical protein [Chloroflexia bacterium]
MAGPNALNSAGDIARQDADSTATTIPGVLAASAGEGGKAAMDAERWREEEHPATPDVTSAVCAVRVG